MKKNLITAGNTWQLYLNKPIVKLLGINQDEYTVLLKIENKILSVQKIDAFEEKNYTKNFLVKKLIKRTSGFGLNLARPLLELMEINPESDFLNLEVCDKVLLIKKF